MAIATIFIVGVFIGSYFVTIPHDFSAASLSAQAAGAGGKTAKQPCLPGHVYYVIMASGGSVSIRDVPPPQPVRSPPGIVKARTNPLGGAWDIQKQCRNGGSVEDAMGGAQASLGTPSLSGPTAPAVSGSAGVGGNIPNAVPGSSLLTGGYFAAQTSGSSDNASVGGDVNKSLGDYAGGASPTDTAGAAIRNSGTGEGRDLSVPGAGVNDLASPNIEKTAEHSVLSGAGETPPTSDLRCVRFRSVSITRRLFF